MKPRPTDFFNVVDRSGKKIMRKKITYVGKGYFNVIVNGKRKSISLDRLQPIDDIDSVIKWFLIAGPWEDWR